MIREFFKEINISLMKRGLKIIIQGVSGLTYKTYRGDRGGRGEQKIIREGV